MAFNSPCVFSNVSIQSTLPKTASSHKTAAIILRSEMTGLKMKLISAVLSAALAVLIAGSAAASDRGPVTNLPIPRYVSLKASEGNVRRGPSLTHRIDWVFKRRDMPLKITAEHGHWRRVQDRDGVGGWVHYSLISGTRHVLIEQDMLALHIRPDAGTPVSARLELGVIARLGKCGPQWCRLTSSGYKGWAPKTALWGVKPDEMRD
jgi:SH3-like domain-containing protein